MKASDPHDVVLAPATLADALRELLAEDWRVEVEGRPLRAPGVFEARVRSGQDWFDLEGGVDFGGRVLPLPDALRAAKAGQTFVPLGDGSQGLLPPGSPNTVK